MTDRFTKGSDGYIRHKGFRVGTLWVNVFCDGDVTIAPVFEKLKTHEKLNTLNDFILLLQRERDLLIEEEEYK
jgi:hypothetical protein